MLEHMDRYFTSGEPGLQDRQTGMVGSISSPHEDDDDYEEHQHSEDKADDSQPIQTAPGGSRWGEPCLPHAHARAHQTAPAEEPGRCEFPVRLEVLRSEILVSLGYC